jgi:hypothetical protein
MSVRLLHIKEEGFVGGELRCQNSTIMARAAINWLRNHISLQLHVE